MLLKTKTIPGSVEAGRRAGVVGALVLVVLAAAGCAGEEAPMEPPETGAAAVRSHLQALRGCLAVRYQFAEDQTADFLIEENIEYMDIQPLGDGYVVRNFLIVDEENAFLHWIQEWQPGEGQRWSLRVTDGQGQLRYETDGVWRFNQWRSEPALAAKPTRDAMRTDYDLLERRNILQLGSDGWIHSEVNLKRRSDGTPVASEVGWIVYRRQASDQACAPAIALLDEPTAA